MPQLHEGPPRPDPFAWHHEPLCPRSTCDGRMHLQSTGDHLHLGELGLQRVQCGVCEHRGFRALNGVHVLFAGRHEHVCSYGPFTHILTVVFSESALSPFLDEDLSPTQAAIYAAQWALLGGQVDGTVRLLSESLALGQCLAHFQRELMGSISRRLDRKQLDEPVQVAHSDPQPQGLRI
ncbi:MAG: hypothetical protein K0S45_3447 [Nitrospira sp.]|jgi:hypothetical protein|nr:hypothetical protein [Nitrospira sp.]